MVSLVYIYMCVGKFTEMMVNETLVRWQITSKFYFRETFWAE